MINQEKKNRIRYLANGVYTATVGTTNIGIITAEIPAPGTPQNVYLVDSGADAEAGKEIYRLLSDLFPDGFTLQAVICTHSNSDHIGGNALLQKKTGCGIWATAGESGSITYPLLQAALIWGGFPFQEITGPVYVAETSTVTRIINFSDQIRLSRNRILSFIPLPGHYFEMCGIRITDEQDNKTVMFLGDSIFGRDMIKKYWIPFIFDVEKFKQTLNNIAEFPADFYVPSHGNVVTEIDALVELNLIAVLETEASIIAALKQEKTAEELLQYIADLNNITLRDGQYALIGSTLRSYLSHLHTQGKITHFIRHNKMFWKSIPLPDTSSGR